MTAKPRDYRSELNPVWCSGCGDFAVLKSFTRTFSRMELSRDNIVMVSGIGCSSRLPGYCATFGFNSVHGRALPIATGLKVARPELTVVVVGGDGDGFSIGGGHIPHAVRRNTDLTYFVIDNNVYGLTKGQSSPTTPKDQKRQKSLAGVEEAPVNPMLMLLSYGAGFLARVEAGDMATMSKTIEEGIRYPGFAFIHCLSACVTYQGRSYQNVIRERSRNLAQEGHDASSYDAAFNVARKDLFALGIIYKR